LKTDILAHDNRRLFFCHLCKTRLVGRWIIS